MAPKILEPLHPLCEEGCMAARLQRTVRAERHDRTLRTGLRLLASPTMAGAPHDMRQIIADAALAAAPEGSE
jgi:hypothetical protein